MRDVYNECKYFEYTNTYFELKKLESEIDLIDVLINANKFQEMTIIRNDAFIESSQSDIKLLMEEKEEKEGNFIKKAADWIFEKLKKFWNWMTGQSDKGDNEENIQAEAKTQLATNNGGTNNKITDINSKTVNAAINSVASTSKDLNDYLINSMEVDEKIVRTNIIKRLDHLYSKGIALKFAYDDNWNKLDISNIDMNKWAEYVSKVIEDKFIYTAPSNGNGVYTITDIEIFINSFDRYIRNEINIDVLIEIPKKIIDNSKKMRPAPTTSQLSNNDVGAKIAEIKKYLDDLSKKKDTTNELKGNLTEMIKSLTNITTNAINTTNAIKQNNMLIQTIIGDIALIDMFERVDDKPNFAQKLLSAFKKK